MVLELGEVRQEMEKNEARMVESIIDANADKTSYYILKYSNWEGQFSNTLRTKYTLWSKKPVVPMIGTKLWLIDNSKGTITLEWDLPMDIINANICASDDKVKQNYDSAEQYGGAIVHA